MLQEDTEFLQTMISSRQGKKLPAAVSSSHYVGIPEHNPSQYCVWSASDATVVSVTTLTTPHATTTFHQPSATPTMSLTQAEHAISDQRARTSRYMMHNTKSRLLDKLNSQEKEDDDEHVMAAFKNKKGVSKARKELLTEIVQDVQVDDDGVLGGTNDAAFGGKRKFGHFSNPKQASSAPTKSTAGNDGMAMSDDFYQRDVVAEYEDLDYDANEQFEDDDVDMGETEQHLNPNAGFAEADTDEDDEVYDETATGAEGLATVTGFKKLLAKARGQTADPLEITEEEKAEKKSGSRPISPKTALPTTTLAASKPTVNDPLANLMTKEETVAAAAAAAAKEPPAKKQKMTGVELDKQGRRVLSVEAVQREIWLNHGSIPVKRISKTFGVKAKDKERYREFLQIAKIVSTLEKDELGNRILVLKQHYKKMG